MTSIADATPAACRADMPRLADGTLDLRELIRQLAESVVNEIMSAEADQLDHVPNVGVSAILHDR